MSKQDGKPRVKLVGTDGNVFALLGRCTRALPSDQAKELADKVMEAQSYGQAIAIMSDYVEAY